MPENIVSLFLSPCLPFLAASLTSLIYGEQSEKSSPSEVSLEAERRDRVSAESGLGPKGPQPWVSSHGAQSSNCFFSLPDSVFPPEIWKY